MGQLGPGLFKALVRPKCGQKKACIATCKQFDHFQFKNLSQTNIRNSLGNSIVLLLISMVKVSLLQICGVTVTATIISH